MIEIHHDFSFEAAHYLPRVPDGHPCGRMHGHSYGVTLRLRGELHPELGWVRDFADVQAAWRSVFERVDHRVLNEVPGLDNPTAELIAAWILAELAGPLPELFELTLRETPTTGVTVRR